MSPARDESATSLPRRGLGSEPSSLATARSSATSRMAPDETREMALLARAIAIVVLVFALMSVVIAVGTGDAASAAGAITQVVIVLGLVHSRRALMAGNTQRGVAFLVLSVLAASVVLAAIPPPVPALAATPIMAVAVALSYLRGRQLKAALVAAWVVSVATAAIVEVVPSSPDLPPEIASVLRIGSFGAVVGLVALVLYRHRRRLDQAVLSAHAASDALIDSELRYRTVVEGVREVIFVVDTDGRWELLNTAWHDLTGFAVDASVGSRVEHFIHPEDRNNHRELTRRVVSGEAGEYANELRFVGADGADIWVDIHARATHDADGRFTGMSGTLADITTRRDLEERLMVQAFHDDLTGLANRALFKDRVEHALTRRSAGRRLVALLFLDLDRFKTVNDSLGHTVGDDLLVAIAGRLREVMRPEDTIARLGGDEFGVLIDEIGAPQEALGLAERITAAFDAPFRIAQRTITIRCSIGVVVEPAGNRTADDLLRDADVAMYRAKVSGRGSYALFEPSMQAEVAARLELESDLREALDSDGLTLAYQPIVDLGDGRVVAVEALARWTHDQRGVVPPSIFIPSAEESGLIIPLGAWVLRRSCLDLAALRAAGGAAADLRMSVNLSPRQLGDRAIVDVVLGALRDAGLTPDVLDIEITESLVLDCGEAGLEYLRQLRAVGCGVYFDDFGTGFSSLGNLRSLPIDGLKIDLSFVARMRTGGVEAAVVEAVVRLGSALDVAVVAEGVEDKLTAERLRELGCPLGQGYHFGRPEPAAAIAARLAADSERPQAA
ncbi:MAG TPA: EAL domain-containing protein [Candidatus Acidoferrum sp.]|nr:EAL domain-containing protein [Candidatus Acidoferrum sp.]